MKAPANDTFHLPPSVPFPELHPQPLLLCASKRKLSADFLPAAESRKVSSGTIPNGENFARVRECSHTITTRRARISSSCEDGESPQPPPRWFSLTATAAAAPVRNNNNTQARRTRRREITQKHTRTTMAHCDCCCCWLQPMSDERVAKNGKVAPTLFASALSYRYRLCVERYLPAFSHLIERCSISRLFRSFGSRFLSLESAVRRRR